MEIPSLSVEETMAPGSPEISTRFIRVEFWSNNEILADTDRVSFLILPSQTACCHLKKKATALILFIVWYLNLDAEVSTQGEL